MSIYDSTCLFEVIGINKIIDKAEIELTLKFIREESQIEEEVEELRNYIINGNQEIAQRLLWRVGANGLYTTDRFRWNQNLGTGTVDISQDTDVPDSLSKHSLKIDCQVVEAAFAGVEFAAICYTIEGYDYFPIHGREVTLSFWVKAVKTGIYCVAFRNSATDRAYIAEYTINTASTWEKKIITLTLDSSGTWLYTNGIGVSIFWVLGAGATYQTSAGAWTAGDYFATANQVNGLDSTNNNFWITQVQLDEGSEALAFRTIPFADELARCKRYYEKSYDYGVYAGAVNNGTVFHQVSIQSNSANRTVYTTVNLTVRKRTAILLGSGLTVYDMAGTAGNVTMNGGSMLALNNMGGDLTCSLGAVDTGTNTIASIAFSWIADADF